MKTNPRVIACAVVLVSTIAPTNLAAGGPPAEKAGTRCIAIVIPTVQGISGNAADAAGGVRDLMAKYLSGPSLKAVVLEALLASQAADEAKEKGCEPLLLVTFTRKPGGRGGLTRALGRAAGASSWNLPGGGSVASATARAGAVGGLQAVSSLAESTKAKDEVRLEYKLQSADGQTEFGPKTETQTAKTDGEDLLTPVVTRAAEAIVSRKPK